MIVYQQIRQLIYIPAPWTIPGRSLIQVSINIGYPESYLLTTLHDVPSKSLGVAITSVTNALLHFSSKEVGHLKTELACNRVELSSIFIDWHDAFGAIRTTSESAHDGLVISICRPIEVANHIINAEDVLSDVLGLTQ